MFLFNLGLSHVYMYMYTCTHVHIYTLHNTDRPDALFILVVLVVAEFVVVSRLPTDNLLVLINRLVSLVE